MLLRLKLPKRNVSSGAFRVIRIISVQSTIKFFGVIGYQGQDSTHMSVLTHDSLNAPWRAHLAEASSRRRPGPQSPRIHSAKVEED